MCDSDPDSSGMTGGTIQSPLNRMHFRDGTPWFSLKGDNDSWEREAFDRGHSPVKTSCASEMEPRAFRCRGRMINGT